VAIDARAVPGHWLLIFATCAKLEDWRKNNAGGRSASSRRICLMEHDSAASRAPDRKP
jgi:hypothetical protein